MEIIFGFVIGVVLTMVLTQKPLQFKVLHQTEVINNNQSYEQVKEFEQDLLKPDAKTDDLYDKMGVIAEDIQNLFGGSDKVDGR